MLQRSGSTHSTSKTEFPSLNLGQCNFIFYNFTAEVPKRTTIQMTRENNTPLSMVRPFSKFWWFLLLKSCNCIPQHNKCSVGPETSICPRGKGKGRDLFYSRIYLFHALQIHFFYLSNVMTPTKSLQKSHNFRLA